MDKPEGFHEIQRLCSKNQLIPSLYKMFTILFVLLVIYFQVFHLTEKLSRVTLYVCCNHEGFIFDLNDRKQGKKKGIWESSVFIPLLVERWLIYDPHHHHCKGQFLQLPVKYGTQWLGNCLQRAPTTLLWEDWKIISSHIYSQNPSYIIRQEA